MEKERIALVIMGVIAVLCVGFGVVSNASKQKEVGKRAELELKLDELAQENGKLQKKVSQIKGQLDEEIRLNQTLSETLGQEQESARALRLELDKINQARRELEQQIQRLESSNQSLEQKIQAKVIGQQENQ